MKPVRGRESRKFEIFMPHFFFRAFHQILKDPISVSRHVVRTHVGKRRKDFIFVRFCNDQLVGKIIIERYFHFDIRSCKTRFEIFPCEVDPEHMP